MQEKKKKFFWINGEINLHNHIIFNKKKKKKKS